MWIPFEDTIAEDGVQVKIFNLEFFSLQIIKAGLFFSRSAPELSSGTSFYDNK
jgi:hypothetical protein